MIDLQNPTNEFVATFIDRFNSDERYYLADKAIVNLFRKFPENKCIEDILLKISVINDLYSTNIFGTFRMARHIEQLQIDDALSAADPTIVNKIAIGHGILNLKGNCDRNFYSFATKYCSWHNKDAYPIYDRFVHKVLVAYKKKDGFSQFEGRDLRVFENFKKVISDFREMYCLTQHNLKEIDKFLWIYGKTLFPNTYMKAMNLAVNNSLLP